jgi:VWFA-related protein
MASADGASVTGKMLWVPFFSLFLLLGSTSSLAFASPEPRAGSTSDVAFGAVPIPDRTIAKTLLPGYTIRHEAPEVRLQFSISDERGHAVNRLSQSDFQVLDNQRTVTHIRNFSRSDDLPLRMGMLLDVSDSVRKGLAYERQAAQFVIGHLVRFQSDQVFLATFSRDATLRQGFTNDREALFQSMSKVGQQGHLTYLFDSLYHVSLDQFSPDPSSDTAQRVLLLISDGSDTGSVHSLEEAITAAQRRGIQIYALTFHPSRFSSPGDQVLKRLADATGGQFLIASNDKDIPGLCALMEQQMRAQFAVSFQPAEPVPGFHSVHIELLRDSRLRVHARQAYFFGTP